MTYSLLLEFAPTISRHRFLEHFRARKHFIIADAEIIYDNADTGVGFRIGYQTRRSLLRSPRVHSAELEINYIRPSYFGLEAEIELSALVAAFDPRIEDLQTDGMGAGPYSPEKFLSGWNSGNRSAVHAVSSGQADVTFPNLPQSRLRTAWRWNYRNAELVAQVDGKQFVPRILMREWQGGLRLFAIWPGADAPILLPEVDYVLAGRLVADEPRLGLAPWAEILDLARRAGFGLERGVLNLRFDRTPDAIARWFAALPLLDQATLDRLSPPHFIDTEVLEAAARMGTESGEEPERP